MANGAQCCALEICCPSGEANRQKRAKLIGEAAGMTGALGLTAGQSVLDWMDREGLTFAPASFKTVIAEIVASTRKHAPTEPAVE